MTSAGDEGRRDHYAIERELADRLRHARSAEERRQLYPVVYRERSERIARHPLVERARDPAAQAAAAAPQASLIRSFVGPEDVLLEIGAGDGAVAHAVAPHVRRAIAVDVTDALAIPDDPSIGYEFRVFDGFSLDLEHAVDFAYSNDVAEHLHPEDFEAHCRAVRAALLPGGRYLCVTPNRLSGPHDVSRHFTAEPSGFHLREYTATELASALLRSGFARARIIVSVGGRRVGPALPVVVAACVEAVVARLPRRLRRAVGPVLAAIKVIAET
ncbi:MAG TPA: class I SAM-dependent methyltransferase [Miltoncostaeaceae bacterium]|nr:class I SAM-dependent methyltransferase [Miltoncostaeaceae bacterium]